MSNLDHRDGGAASALTIIGCAAVVLVAAAQLPAHAVEVDPNIGTWADQIAPPPDAYLPADRPQAGQGKEKKPRAGWRKKPRKRSLQQDR